MFIIIMIFNGCTQGEFCNPELFAKRYRNLSGNEISPESFIGTDFEDKKLYLFEAAQTDGITTLVKLFTDRQGRIAECRIVISKLDENGKPVLLTSAAREAFFESSKNVASALSGEDKEKTADLLCELLDIEELSKTENVEKAAEHGSQRYVYVSNEVVSEIVIYNKWLCKAEETQKPESKVAFDKTTNVRTETVPHK